MPKEVTSTDGAEYEVVPAGPYKEYVDSSPAPYDGPERRISTEPYDGSERRRSPNSQGSPLKPSVPVDSYMIWDVNSPPYQVCADEDGGVETLQRAYEHGGDSSDLRLVKVTEVKDIGKKLQALADAKAKEEALAEARAEAIVEKSAKAVKKDERAEYSTK